MLCLAVSIRYDPPIELVLRNDPTGPMHDADFDTTCTILCNISVTESDEKDSTVKRRDIQDPYSFE